MTDEVLHETLTNLRSRIGTQELREISKFSSFSSSSGVSWEGGKRTGEVHWTLPLSFQYLHATGLKKLLIPLLEEISSISASQRERRENESEEKEKEEIVNLELNGNALGDQGVDALIGILKNHLLPPLRLGTLNLSYNSIGTKGLGSLFRFLLSTSSSSSSSPLPLKYELNLSENPLSAEALQLLSSFLHDLSSTSLSSSSFFHSLNLSSCSITATSLKNLFLFPCSSSSSFPSSPFPSSPHLSFLRRLNLSRNNLGDLGVSFLHEVWSSSLSSSSHSSLVWHLSVRAVDLQENDIGPKGAESLAALSLMAKLEHLNVAGNKIGNHGLQKMADVFASASASLSSSPSSSSSCSFSSLPLRFLDLSNTGITYAGKAEEEREEGSSHPLSRLLQVLLLPPSTSSLSFPSSFGCLEELVLQGNLLGAQGAKDLTSTLLVLASSASSSSSPSPISSNSSSASRLSLKRLQTRGTQSGDEGAEYWSRLLRSVASPSSSSSCSTSSTSALALGSLTSLDLSCNRITEKGGKALLSALLEVNTTLWELDLGKNPKITKGTITLIQDALEDNRTLALEKLKLKETRG